jgi:hypothetical protein
MFDGERETRGEMCLSGRVHEVCMVCSKWKSTNIAKASGSSRGLRISAYWLANGTLVKGVDFGMPPGLKLKLMHAANLMKLCSVYKKRRLL